MLALSSTRDAIQSIERATQITAEAYTLHGPVLRALEDAAQRGARVAVKLERSPYGSSNRGLARENARLVGELRAAGADARLADPIHAKTMSVDGVLYLDEKNWHCGDIVLREDDRCAAASIPMVKRDALAEEARLLAAAKQSDETIVESESFGAGNETYNAVRELGLAHASPRLLVSENDLRGNARERSLLELLMRDGVRVRVCADSAKLAVAGDRAWLGSANATYAGGKFAMPDWGIRTRDASIVEAVRARLEAEWRTAKELRRLN
jgi:phosphatidylserine/phosphatidylglycerophosphate/cardiolipin synthase-like enzyme